jgi:hypothetical protein
VVFCADSKSKSESSSLVAFSSSSCTVHPSSQPVSLLQSRQCPRRLTAPPHHHLPPSSTTGRHHPSPRQPEHPYVDHHLHYPPLLPRFATANYHCLTPSDGVPPPWLPSLGRPTPKQTGPCIAGHTTDGGGSFSVPGWTSQTVFMSGKVEPRPGRDSLPGSKHYGPSQTISEKKTRNPIRPLGPSIGWDYVLRYVLSLLCWLVPADPYEIPQTCLG